MSLINKMLQDLEARNDAAAGKKPKDPAYHDLRPVNAPSPLRSRRNMAPVLVLIAVAAAGVLVWLRGPEVVAEVIIDESRRLLALIPDILEKEKPLDTRVIAKRAAIKEAETAPPPATKPPAPRAGPEHKTAKTVSPPPVPAGARPKDIKAVVPKAQTPPPAPVVRPKIASSRITVRQGDAESPGLVEKNIKPMSPEEEAENNYRQAAAYLQQGRRGDAENGLRAALAANHAHAPARELLAGLALQNGRTLEAQQLLEEGLQKNPKHYSFAQFLARLYVDQGAEQKALALMEGAAEAGAADPAFLAFLGALYQRAGRHADAVAAYTKAVTLRPDEGRWWLGLGISLEAEKNLAAASDAYTRAQQSGALDQNLQRYVEQRLTAIKNK